MLKLPPIDGGGITSAAIGVLRDSRVFIVAESGICHTRSFVIRWIGTEVHYSPTITNNNCKNDKLYIIMENNNQ